MKKIITLSLLIVSFSITVHSQNITTIAGSVTPPPPGNQGYAGNGDPATNATLNFTTYLALDDSGNVFISDCHNNVVREVNAKTGVITTVAGNGTQSYSGDGGPATDAELYQNMGLYVDDSENIYIADYGNDLIRKVSAKTGFINTIAGSHPGTHTWGGDGGLATDAYLSYPTGVTLDDSGNVIITDQWNWVVREVSAKTGIINTIAGDHNLNYSFSGNGGQATNAALYLPSETAVDDSGNLYIADQQNQEIRKVTKATGIITDYAGSVNGNTGAGYSGDGGSATSAEFYYPGGLYRDDSGNIFVADTWNNVIRKITKSTGIITTVGGNGYNHGNSTGGFSGDGGPATAAELSDPWGVALDQCGDIYVADTKNNLVRKVSVSDSIKVSFKPSICAGANDTLTASGAGTFHWSPSIGLSDTTGAVVIANPTVTTTYIITGTGLCAGSATPDTVVVTVGTAPALTVLEQPSTPVCSGQGVTLSISGSGSNFTWSPSTSLSVASGSSVVATPTATTTYTVSGTSGGCTSTGMDTVNIVAAPALIIKPQDTTICNGSSVTLFAPSNGSGYVWSPPATLSSAAADSVIASPTVQTTYTVAGTDSVGCSAIGYDTVNVQKGFNKPVIADNDNLITSTATEGNQWYKDGVAINGATGESYTATDTGCYYDIATNIANGCSSISNTVCITKLAGINQLTINSGQLTVYPNPTGGEIFVNISSSVADINDWNLQIIDVLGRTVYTKLSLNYSNDIDLSNLSGGVYFITVINGTSRAVVPVVKQ